MLVDEVEIEVVAGAGGDGSASLRRQAYVPRGGPDGGDGGDGGDVVIAVSAHLRTLIDLKYKHKYAARAGVSGLGIRKTGKSGRDLVIKVPPGTVVYDADSGEQVADLLRPGQKLIAARGGVGGRGNTHFATAARQTPRFAEMGIRGEERRLRLELRLLADVGIIGFPNAGKSTLISVVSAARPKVANYPFTTLAPNLGVVKVDRDVSYVIADMPGLIEGAAEGAGLGHQFLRHIERTRLLLHVVDVASVEGRDPISDFEHVNTELARFKPELAQLEQIVALNKIDLPQAEQHLKRCQEYMQARDLATFAISAATTHGVAALMHHVGARLMELFPKVPFEEQDTSVEIFSLPKPAVRPLHIEKPEKGIFILHGTGVEEMVAQTNLRSSDALMWLQDRLDQAGIIDRLEAAGAVEGDTIIIGEIELEYLMQAGA